MKQLIMLLTLGLILASCSLSRIKSGASRSGSSMDVLRDNETINIRGVTEDKVKIKVITKNGTSCLGSFDFHDSGRSWFGITAAKNTYHGKFSSKSKACKEALGKNSSKGVELQHIRLGGILGSSWMSTEGVVVCDDQEGFCLGQNTFKILKE